MAVSIDDESFYQLLDESQEYFEEKMTIQEDEEQKQVTSWHQNFNERIRNGIGSLETFPDTVKDKLKTLRVRMSAKDEVVEEEQKSASQGTSKTNFGAKVKVGKDVKNVSSTGSSLTNLRTNVLVKITRRVQQMVHNHALAFEFIQKLFNRLEERVAVVEEKVVIEKEWVEKEVQEQMQEVKVKVQNLEKENEVLLRDIDETRQRGMKGNIIISTRKEQQHLLNPHPTSGGQDDQTTMCRKLILAKTGVDIKEGDIVACHPMGRRGSSSYIVRIQNQRPNSGWESLAAGLTSGKGPQGNFVDNGVFLSFQLTERRKEILRSVKEARRLKEEKVRKFKVDQNGKIWITSERGTSGVMKKLAWKEVTSLEELHRECGKVIPLPALERGRRQEQEAGAGARGGARARV